MLYISEFDLINLFHVTDSHCMCFIGSLEGIGSIEAVMEHIAAVLGKDEMDIKISNWDAEKYPKLPKFWETMQIWADIANRKANIKKFNEANILDNILNI